VKIEPNSLGVGLYQHDVKAKHLRDSLDGVVESCVNYVGVDLNTASPSLLRYVSGLNQLTAQRIFDHRQANGPFASREQLKAVSGVGEAAFVQAAGFLKLTGGENPLDGTWIHPESYETAQRVLEQLGAKPEDLADKEKVAKIAEKSRGIDLQRMALQLRVGTLSLHDIITQLTRPGRDPRDGLPPPIFKQGILKLDDLAAGHGAARHGAQRRRLRRVRRYRPQRLRPRAYQPLGGQVRQRPARSRLGRRHRQSLGHAGRQTASPRIAHDDSARR
jgi:uncharacterized protein